MSRSAPHPSTRFRAAGSNRVLGQSSSDWVERLGSFGFAAKGLLYVTIGVLAATVGAGSGGEQASQTGAIQQLSDTSHGTIVLIALAVGLAGYALLRLAHVAVNPSGESGAKGLVMRGSYLVRAVIFGGLTAYTVRVLMAGSGGSGGGSSQKQLTGRVLELPLGAWLVGGAALVLFGVALFQAKRAVDQDFLDHVRASGTPRTVARWSGVIGHGARAVLFGTLGVMLTQAALAQDASQSGGVGSALQELGGTAGGTSLLLAVAVGLVAYGVYCGVVSVWGTARRAD